MRVLAIRSGRRDGFTLLELLISLALALVMILGINEVFSLTSRTVGAGQVLLSTYAGDRAGQATISADISQAVPMSQTPCLIIDSNYGFAFRNRTDYTTDVDQDPSTFNGGTPAIYPALIGPRSHRLDRIAFFARGLFARQTGSGSSFIDTGSNGVPITSAEAWIVYGHLNIADNGGGFTNSFPGAKNPGVNQNNFFAGQWILGRSVIQLIPTNPPSTPASVLAPLQYGSMLGSGTGDAQIETSRHDFAPTSIAQFGQQLTAAMAIDPKTGAPSATVTYWNMLLSDPGVRYEANLYPVKPLSSASTALLVPCFLPGCTHFIVEYTGDFVTQVADPKNAKYGVITAAGGDGIPDFQIVNGVRQTRWYGLPRCTSNNPTGNISPDNDVVPLRDAMAAASVTWPGIGGNPPQTNAPFERDLPKIANGTYGGMNSSDRYIVAWGPDTRAAVPTAPGTNSAIISPTPTPTMLRFTLVLDDMSNRTGAGLTFEYVVQLQQ